MSSPATITTTTIVNIVSQQMLYNSSISRASSAPRVSPSSSLSTTTTAATTIVNTVSTSDELINSPVQSPTQIQFKKKCDAINRNRKIVSDIICCVLFLVSFGKESL